MLVGGIGYIEDVLILILISVYNNPIEVIEWLLFGTGPGGLKRNQIADSMDISRLEVEDRLKATFDSKASSSNSTSSEDQPGEPPSYSDSTTTSQPTSIDSSTSDPNISTTPTIQASPLDATSLSILGTLANSAGVTHLGEVPESEEEEEDDPYHNV